MIHQSMTKSCPSRRGPGPNSSSPRSPNQDSTAYNTADPLCLSQPGSVLLRAVVCGVRARVPTTQCGCQDVI